MIFCANMSMWLTIPDISLAYTLYHLADFVKQINNTVLVGRLKW